MKKGLALLLVFVMAFALYGCGETANSTDTASEQQTFFSSDTIEFEIYEAGFCNASQMWYSKSTSTKKIEGKSYQLTEYKEMEYTAHDDSHILFAIKAHIRNISDHSLIIADDLDGYITFKGKDGKAYAQTFAFQCTSSSQSNTIRKGEETDALCISRLPIDCYKGYKGCTYELSGISVNFGKDVGFTESIKFEMPENELVELESNNSVNKFSGVPMSYTFVQYPDGHSVKMYYDSLMDTLESDSEFEIVDCKATEYNGNGLKLKADLRNLSDKFFPVVIIEYQVLDSSGDALKSGQIVVEDIDEYASKAVNTYISDQSYDSFDAVRIVNYSVASPMGIDLILEYTVNIADNNLFKK